MLVVDILQSQGPEKKFQDRGAQTRACHLGERNVEPDPFHPTTSSRVSSSSSLSSTFCLTLIPFTDQITDRDRQHKKPSFRGLLEIPACPHSIDTADLLCVHVCVPKGHSRWNHRDLVVSCAFFRTAYRCLAAALLFSRRTMTYCVFNFNRAQ